MTQIRLYSEAQSPAAQLFFKQLSSLFEEDGYPVAIIELCEASQLYEISAYAPRDKLVAVRAIMLELQAKLNINHTINEEALPDIDWVQHSLKSLPPVETQAFFIYGQHHSDKIPANKLAIKIEASQAFGTGHHATTVDCLKLLEQQLPTLKPERILDIGTGSGILAIAAAKLAQKYQFTTHITANDIDPIAVKVARENCALNEVADYIILCHANDTTANNHNNNADNADNADNNVIENHSPFTLIMANILARPLTELAPHISKLSASGGFLILSGILQTQAEKLIAAYESCGFSLQKTLLTGEWASLYLKSTK